MKKLFYLCIIVVLSACVGNKDKVRVLPILGDADVEYKRLMERKLPILFIQLYLILLCRSRFECFDSDQYKK